MVPEGIVTVTPGQLEACIVLEWVVNELPHFMVRDVTGIATSGYTTVDSDGVRAPGKVFIVGPFPGLTAVNVPTTAVELSATAADASGNKATGMAVLSITD